jgi:hypothetical protein
MADKNKASDDDVLKEARDAFSQCQDAERDNRKTALDDIKFAREGEQWPSDIVKQRQQEGRPCLTINKMPAFIRQVVNDARQNKPSIKVHPADSGADPETAEVMNGLIRNIEYTSNADTAYDTATECAVSGGFGYIRVGLDYAYDDSFDMDITINRVSNPFSVYGDPNSRAADSSDWDVAFVVDRLSFKQFETEYKGSEKVNWDDDSWTELKGSDWIDDKTVQVAEWWTREKIDRPIVLLQNGAVLDREELENDEDLQILLQTGMLQVHGERMAKSCKVKQRTMSGVEVLEDRDWLGKYIPIIPVYGDEFDIEGKRFFRSLIHNGVDAQRMFNYWRTTSTELVALAPKTPFIGPVGAFNTDMAKWNSANKQSHPFIQYDPAALKGAPPPQRIPLDGGIAAGALQEALNASDDMKAVIGLYDASLGAKSNETSGKAILARQREGDVSTFHFIDNMARAIRHTGRVLLDLIPKVYTSERIIRVIGEDGSQEARTVNTKEPVEQTDKKGKTFLAMHDLTAGKYDLTVTTGPSFTTRREEAAMQMTEMIRAFPQAAPVVGPHLAKNLDWPGADEIAEELEAVKSGQIPEQAQKQMEELAQKVEKLEQENLSLKVDTTVEAKKAQDQAAIQKQKTDDDFALGQQKLANEFALQKIKIEGEQAINIRKQADAHESDMQQNRNRRDIEALKAGGEEQSEGGKKVVKSGTELVMKGLEGLGQLIVKQGEMQARSTEKLAQIIAAPNELVRDPKTGRASGSRKVFQ